MKTSIRKLYNYFRLEAERGYDNNAVMGGLDRMLGHWEAEARVEGVDEDLIQLVSTRIRDYPRLSLDSRRETLLGVWNRIQREQAAPGIDFEFVQESEESGKIPREVSEVQESITEIAVEPEISAELEKVTGADTQVESLGEGKVKKRQSAQEQISTEPVALDAPVTVLPGVGPSNSKVLERLGIYTLRDMLYFFPRRYEDYSLLKPINRLRYGDELTVIGTVESVGVRKLKGGQTQLVEVMISDGSAALRVNWFNQVWIARRLRKGLQISVSGKVEQYLGRLIMNNPEWEPLDQRQLNTQRIVPVYPLTANLTQRRLRHLMDQVVSYWASRVRDPLPRDLLDQANLIDLSSALAQIHFPDTWDDLAAARHRLSFDEIFLLQLGVLSQKKAWKEREARKLSVSDEWLDQQIKQFPYVLTPAQQRTIMDIRQDLVSGSPMNRLIQGDVGSGKTAVAGIAIGIILQNGAQAAVMAPTSILAEQHYEYLSKMLVNSGAPLLREDQIRLLIGATPESEKGEIRDGLRENRIKLLVGTHALIEDPVIFAELQLAVVDEQHRFGVKQRAALRAKGDNPHLLVMTATPIPRSLALTVYGDLDVSVIDEMPPGRKPVSTHVLAPRELERAYSLIRNELEQGHQAFIIYPLVEESEKIDAKAAIDDYEYIKDRIFPQFEVGLLHGRMKPDEKEREMKRFRDGENHILVSTTVVEVGVDVPNANVMLIEGANRFGLAQLHQLRGRVGRGSEKAYCLLVPDQVDAIENERLQVMTETTDGFVLAEKDLQQRGPGEFLGTRQSGFSELRLASLTDVRLIEKARRQAKSVFDRDPELTEPEHAYLASILEQFWGEGEGDIS